MKKKKYYRVLELTSELTLNRIVGEMTGTDTFDTELEALQFISDYNGGFYQLIILEVYE